MAGCPCCRSGLLRQVNHIGVYWFCLNCRQEMPVIEAALMPHSANTLATTLSGDIATRG